MCFTKKLLFWHSPFYIQSQHPPTLTLLIRFPNKLIKINSLAHAIISELISVLCQILGFSKFYKYLEFHEIIKMFWFNIISEGEAEIRTRSYRLVMYIDSKPRKPNIISPFIFQKLQSWTYFVTF